MSIRPSAGLMLAAALMTACAGPAQRATNGPVDAGLDPKFTNAAALEATRRRETIEAEIQELAGHPWAGKYFYGDGLGVNVTLHLAPASGFVFEWHGCLGLYDRNYGPARTDQGVVKLDGQFPNNPGAGFQGIATDLVPIPWGPRRYLVPLDAVADFCNSVNAGYEPRTGGWGRHLLRVGDETKPVKGPPEVPEAYRSWLLTAPIAARVTAVGETRTKPAIVPDYRSRITPVTLEVGAADGVRPQMEFHLVEPDGVDSATVICVAERSCEAEVTQTGDEPRPAVGWKMSTRPRWR